MLRNQAGDKAVVLRFHKDQLPCFTLWKNTAGRRDGYVTGLEPATNYPNPRPFEKARNRIVTLPVDGRYVVETTLEVLATATPSPRSSPRSKSCSPRANRRSTPGRGSRSRRRDEALRILLPQPRYAQILTTDSAQQHPIVGPGGSETNHGIHRHTQKREFGSALLFRVLPGGNSRP